MCMDWSADPQPAMSHPRALIRGERSSCSLPAYILSVAEPDSEITHACFKCKAHLGLTQNHATTPLSHPHPMILGPPQLPSSLKRQTVPTALLPTSLDRNSPPSSWKGQKGGDSRKRIPEQAEPPLMPLNPGGPGLPRRMQKARSEAPALAKPASNLLWAQPSPCPSPQFLSWVSLMKQKSLHTTRPYTQGGLRKQFYYSLLLQISGPHVTCSEPPGFGPKPPNSVETTRCEISMTPVSPEPFHILKALEGPWPRAGTTLPGGSLALEEAPVCALAGGSCWAKLG
ncbi:hypothetical protein P7K49_012241 [Saguinus oedipus]|uniref:Uncharacterized protein n=1 Tax=Saguinus oedipus TaxID=9490 RepID=A0ABQ9VUH7_SAGOE|nr:hypothetical protein P7K49_012241 [Saguinus oedipus]